MNFISGYNPAVIATLTIHLHIPGCASLKEKRGRIKPLINRLHREFNVSAAEIDRQDAHQHAVIACAMIGNDAAFLQSALSTAARWLESNWTDGDVIEQRIEIL